MAMQFVHDFDAVVKLRGTDSKKWNNYPEDVIPMWIADTDFLCAQPIIDAMVERARLGVYGYPLVDNSLNNAVAHWMKTRFGWTIEEEWVEFAPAVVAGIVNAVQAFAAPGEKVVIPSPVYHPFQSISNNCGREKSLSTLHYVDGEWQIDFNDLEKKLADPRARILLLCNPHNPLGKMYTRDELLRMGEMCLKHGIIIISDEIHSDLAYDGRKHICFPTLSPELAKISMVFVNPSKTFNIPGMRSAAAIIPDAQLRKRFHTQIIANRMNGRTTFGTLPLVVAYTKCAYYADQMVQYLQGSRDRLLRYFEEKIPAISVTRPQSTYLLWLDCRKLGLSQEALQDFMLSRAKVAMNSGLTFGPEGEGFMRMNIACTRATLDEALRRIETAVKTL